MSVTFAEARAACVECFGEPSWSGVRCGSDLVEWSDGRGRACLSIGGRRGAVWMDAWTGLGLGRTSATWTLAGEPSPYAPLIPLPDAIDAAARWLAERNDPTKGP